MRQGRERSGIGGAAGNRNVHLAAVSSWYGYLIDNDLTDRNPAVYHEDCGPKAGAERTTAREQGIAAAIDEYRAAGVPVVAALTTIKAGIDEFRNEVESHLEALGDVETEALAHAQCNEAERAEYARRRQEAEAAAAADREAVQVEVRRQRQAEEDRATVVTAMQDAETHRKHDVEAAQQRAEGAWRAGDAQAVAAAATERAQTAAAALDVACEAQRAAEERADAAEAAQVAVAADLEAVQATNGELKDALAAAAATASVSPCEAIRPSAPPERYS